MPINVMRIKKIKKTCKILERKIKYLWKVMDQNRIKAKPCHTDNIFLQLMIIKGFKLFVV